ncbi:MAG: COQ9 family protein [Hellea sp.]|nr:COQ9 family protein [Hellea sp.]
MEDRTKNSSSEARRDILEAMLRHVPFDGWTKTAMRKAINEVELPSGADALFFPGGPLEILEFWAEQLDQQAGMIIANKGLGNLRIRDKITECVWVRLSLLDGHEQAARRAISRLALPDAVGAGPKHVWRTADMIWRAIGDTSTDGNFYSKRAILSGVIASSAVKWLADNSAEKAESRAFLEARISNVMQFEKAKFQFRKAREHWPDPVSLLGRLRYGHRRRRYR